jgi:hypothetical protein
MSCLYPVIEVRPEWVLEPEQMGSKDKFWYREPVEGARMWLFKYPQPGTGQHWAEKIATSICERLGISHARVELCQFQGVQGSATESFVRDGLNLFHGNQLLVKTFAGYDPRATFRHSGHTLTAIFEAIGKAFITPDYRQKARIAMAGYLVLDALIGNTDRHHENWGLLLRRAGDQWRGWLAPTFDHASSLGRELHDERRRRLLVNRRVPAYSENGHGGIYWTDTDARGPSPLELVRRAASTWPVIFGPALERIRGLSKTDFEAIIDRIPGEWMTPVAREFTLALLCYNLEQLRHLLP